MRRSPSLNSAVLPTYCSAMLALLPERFSLRSAQPSYGSQRRSFAPSILRLFKCNQRQGRPGIANITCLAETVDTALVGARRLTEALSGRPAVRSGDLVDQGPDLLDPDLHHVAGLEELAARRADPGRRAGEDQVARDAASSRSTVCAICSARLKIMSLLLESCLRTSLTQSLRPRFWGRRCRSPARSRVRAGRSRRRSCAWSNRP